MKTPNETDLLRAALEVAVDLVMANEPGDSRAVSDVAVALATVVARNDNNESWRIIEEHRARLRARGPMVNVQPTPVGD